MPRVFIPRIITEDNALGGSKIEKSLRFNGDDTYLSRTPSSASNRRTWTWSAWIKKTKNDAVQDLFSAYDGSGAYNIIRIGSTNQLYFQSNSAEIKTTNAVLRNTTAWYHIVVAIDTTSATAADRVIIYINGTRQSLATDNSVSQNTDYFFNTTNAHTIGVYANGSSYNFDGYMAEINFVDGYQYDTSYFGFTDGQTGMWMPKRYEGTYGTNGFYLDFGNASSGDEYQKYTVPTASFTNDSDTLLLINNNESNGSTTFTDSSSNGYSISGTGSIAHSTAQSKFGSSSILFDGSDDSLSVGGNGTLYSEMTASSNKTYEAFMYLNADDFTYIMSISSNQRYLGFYMNASSGKFGFNGNHPNPYTSVEGFVPALDVPIGRWFHVFVQRNADGTMSVGFDGKILVDSVAEGADVSASGTTGPLKIGSQHYYGSTHRYFYDGYMDEIRMSDTPRYTALGGAGTCGQDYSGNNNNFAPVNFSLGGIVKDTPTNNFSTVRYYGSPASSGSSLTEGNMKFITGSSGSARNLNRQGISTLLPASGKWYAEVKAVDSNGQHFIGVGPYQIDISSTANNTRYVYLYSDGDKYVRTAGSESNATYGSSYTQNDVIGIYIDMDASTPLVSFSKNGQWANGSGSWNQSTPTSYITLGDSFFTEDTAGHLGIGFLVSSGSGGTSSTYMFNFGQDSTFSNLTLAGGNADDNGIGDFKYPVPRDALALCAANLSPNVPSIIRPQKHFDTLLYTGTGSSPRTIGGLEFKPDFVWLKHRSGTSWHRLQNSVVGANKLLYSNANNAEATDEQYGHLNSFTKDGFIIDDPNADGLNNNGGTYVAWCWKAGGAAVSNSDGATTSQVSANTEAGFSIVTYTGTGSSTTIGHGLGKKPEMIFMKSRSATGDWAVLDKSNSTAEYTFYLNDNNAYGSSSGYTFYADTPPTSSVWTVNSASAVNASGVTYVAYCWTEIPGYSKIGSYTGNGSDDGTYIYLGFRPAWVMVKRNNYSSNWSIYDNKRDPDNPVYGSLNANLNNAESTGSVRVDFLSDGFKHKNSDGGASGNVDGGNYIYMAFAEQPGVTPFNTVPNAR